MTPLELIQLIKQQPSIEAVKQVIELWEGKKEKDCDVGAHSGIYVRTDDDRISERFSFSMGDTNKHSYCSCPEPHTSKNDPGYCIICGRLLTEAAKQGITRRHTIEDNYTGNTLTTTPPITDSFTTHNTDPVQSGNEFGKEN